MTTLSQPAAAGDPAPGAALRTLVAPRPTAVAVARCAAYAAFSELTASPHDVDVAAALAARLPTLAGLPYPTVLPALVREVAGTDLARLRAEYSGLFEVGSEGPPVPIREDLQLGQLAGTREDIVRFYDFFGYRLGERFAWAPDHLSVELEFLHFLCFCEADQPDTALSYQLAQLDFTARHPARWVGKLAVATGTHAGDSLYARVIAALAGFIAADLAWQRGTISPSPDGEADELATAPLPAI
jgi:DMSO reductase family type II enzyme chaperone